MKINSQRLADVIAGQCQPETLGDLLHCDLQDDPRLRELFWFLEFKSRSPGQLDQILQQVAPLRDGQEWMCGSERFRSIVQFLCDGTGGYFRTGMCPPEITAPIFKLMERHAQTAKEALAETKVSSLILKELDLAIRHKVPVPIIGDSRFGKTKAVTVWNEMRPGLTRVVTVPESNRDWDFYAAHADALGIEYNDRTTLQRIKRAIQHVIQNSGFFICYDEARTRRPNGSIGCAAR